MNTNITAKQAKEIAQEYIKEYKLRGTISDDLDKSVIFYEGFDGVVGPAWVIWVDIDEQTIYDVHDKYNIIVSDVKASVEYIIDTNGHPCDPHLQ